MKQTSTVRQILNSRKDALATGRDATDGAHVALVLEGGGMRGVTSISLACGLADAGLLNAFDSVHGSSAGACAAAYFATGQHELGASIYYEDLVSSEFIDIKRCLVGKPIMSTSFLIDEVMKNRKPLESSKIISRPGYVNLVLTRAVDGEERLVSTYKTAEEIYSYLRATICIPFVAGPPIKIGADSYFDGGLRQQIAVNSALASGATHVLILMSRREDHLRRKDRTKGFSFEASALRYLYGKPMETIFRQRNSGINKILDWCQMGASDTKVAFDYIALHKDTPELGRLTKNKEILYEAYQIAKQTGFKYLDRSIP